MTSLPENFSLKKRMLLRSESKAQTQKRRLFRRKNLPFYLFPPMDKEKAVLIKLLETFQQISASHSLKHPKVTWRVFSNSLSKCSYGLVKCRFYCCSGTCIFKTPTNFSPNYWIDWVLKKLPQEKMFPQKIPMDWWIAVSTILSESYGL